MADLIGYSTTGNEIRGPFIQRGFSLALRDFENRLKTYRGERMMRPEFGTNLMDLIMEPLTEELKESVKEEIRNAAIEEGGRIIVNEIDVIELVNGIRCQINVEYAPTGESDVLTLEVIE